MDSVINYFKNLTPKKIVQIVVLVLVFLVAFVGRRWWYVRGETVDSLSYHMTPVEISVSVEYYAPETDGPESKHFTLMPDSEEGVTLLKVLDNLRFHDFPAGILPRDESKALQPGQYSYAVRLEDAAGEFFLVTFRANDWAVANAVTALPMSVPQGKDIGNTLGVLLWLYAGDSNSVS